jgi:hypothetical protein
MAVNQEIRQALDELAQELEAAAADAEHPPQPGHRELKGRVDP